MQLGILVGILTGVGLGVINGLIVTKLNVNPIIATLGTLAAFAGLAFLVAPDGKPVGVITQPDFTWLATGRLFPDLPRARAGRGSALDRRAHPLPDLRRWWRSSTT